MNLFSTFAVRSRWTSKLLAQRLLNWQGRRDFFKAFYARKRMSDRMLQIQLPQGTVFINGLTAVIDLRTFAQVFLDEIYGGLSFRDRVVIDVGAHKGYFAAYALLKGAKATVCYEPEDSNFKALALFSQTIRSDGRVIEIHHEAIGSDGEMDLYVSADSWAHTTVCRQDFIFSKVVRVSSRSLATALSNARERFSEDDFILKIDAEGVESAALLRTPPELFSRVGEIIFEFHSFSGLPLQGVLDRMNSIGFECVGFVKEADLYQLRRQILAQGEA